MPPSRDYGRKRNRWTAWIAITVALAVGGTILWTMQAAFQVGDDMVRSIDATRPLSRPPPAQGERGYVRAHPRAEERPTVGVPAAGPPRSEITGRVVIPAGTPADEELHVRLVSMSRIHSQASVDPQHGFRFAPGPSVDGAQLSLEGRYLFLPRAVPVDFDALPDAFVLEPLLGGRIVGRIRVPEERSPARPLLAGATVWMYQQGSDGADARTARAQLDDALGFEFRALVPSVPVEIFERQQWWTILAQEDLTVQAGETRELVLDVNLGAALGGTVRDVDGAPIAGARCLVRFRGSQTAHVMDLIGRDLTREDGTFLLLELYDDVEALLVRCGGYHEQEERLAPLDVNEWRTDLDVRLRKLGSIAGRVVWPDGRPADGAWVCAEPTKGDGEPRTVLADETGCFELDRLSGESFTITAGLEMRAWYEELDDKPGAPGAVVVTGIAGGTQDLVLRLANGAALSGRVVDEDGVPWNHALVVARPILGGEVCSTPLRAKSGGPSASDGAYRIEGLHAGEWEVQATSGAFRSPRSRVRIGAADQGLDLVLSRVPALAGVVLDEHGQPAAKQRVHLVRPERAADALDFRSDEPAARTDELGRFEIAECEPGVALLWAGSRWDHLSPFERVDVVAGRPIAGLTLRLQRLGRLRCRVLDVDKRSNPEADVIVRPVAGEGLKIDANRIASHRRVPHVEQRLPAGEYLVHAYHQKSLSVPVVVRVDSDRETEVVLELAPAARMRVVVLGARGRAQLAVRDPAGEPAFGELDPLASGGRMWSHVLLPGSYVVVATDAERRTVEREVELCAGEERSLTLKFDD